LSGNPSCKLYFCRQLKRFWSSLRKRISDEMITQRRTSTTARIDHHMSAWLHGRVNTEENHLSFYFERQRKTILVTSSVRQFGDYFWKAKAKEASAPVLFFETYYYDSKRKRKQSRDRAGSASKLMLWGKPGPTSWRVYSRPESYGS